MKAICKADGVLQRFRKIAKEQVHLGGGFEVAFAVAGEERAGGIEMRVMAQAGEHIEHLAAGAPRVKDAAGGEEREMMTFAKFALDAFIRRSLAP